MKQGEIFPTHLHIISYANAHFSPCPFEVQHRITNWYFGGVYYIEYGLSQN